MVKSRLVRAAQENPPKAAAARGRSLWHCLSLTTSALGHFQAPILEFIHLRLLGLFLVHDDMGLEVTGPSTPLNLEMELLLSLKTGESRGEHLLSRLKSYSSRQAEVTVGTCVITLRLSQVMNHNHQPHS